MEKSYQDMTPQELRVALAEYERSNAAPGPQQPDAPGCETLKPELRDAAATLYGHAVLAKRADQITPSEREFLRAAVTATLEGMK